MSTAASTAEKPAQTWWVYLLLCERARLYTGIAVDVDERFHNHVAGKGAKFTKAFTPIKILGRKKCESRSEASREEWRIKQLTPSEKRAVFKVRGRR